MAKQDSQGGVGGMQGPGMMRQGMPNPGMPMSSGGMGSFGPNPEMLMRLFGQAQGQPFQQGGSFQPQGNFGANTGGFQNMMRGRARGPLG